MTCGLQDALTFAYLNRFSFTIVFWQGNNSCIIVTSSRHIPLFPPYKKKKIANMVREHLRRLVKYLDYLPKWKVGLSRI